MQKGRECWVDTRALEHNGQWGLYKCNSCGKLFWKRMCTAKKVKKVFCNTLCKKNSQVKVARRKIDGKIFREVYSKYYNLVKQIAFQTIPVNNISLLEDCMQEGFLELWFTYNRNNLDCSKKYLRKAIKHKMIDKLRYWNEQDRKYVNWDKVITVLEDEQQIIDSLLNYEDNTDKVDYSKYLDRIVKEHTKELLYLTKIDLVTKKEDKDKLAKTFGYSNYRSATKSMRTTLRTKCKDITEYLKEA